MSVRHKQDTVSMESESVHMTRECTEPKQLSELMRKVRTGSMYALFVAGIAVIEFEMGFNPRK